MSEHDEPPRQTKAPRAPVSTLRAAILRINASLDVAAALREVVESARGGLTRLPRFRRAFTVDHSSHVQRPAPKRKQCVSPLRSSVVVFGPVTVDVTEHPPAASGSPRTVVLSGRRQVAPGDQARARAAQSRDRCDRRRPRVLDCCPRARSPFSMSFRCRQLVRPAK